MREGEHQGGSRSLACPRGILQEVFGVEKHCCEDMRREVERVCDRHPNRHDCPDCLVSYSPVNRQYGLLIHDGGSSSFRIRFCPWCGGRLPEPLRET